ncbi:serine hydrolase [Amycolatopsis sp. Hca4]|uniref:serine hydrolase n=1 Tax=Amycolatopsis sp. Hca4 TaxID=2742131 RepID=UPI001592A5CB|nr:serine hydrolase [Amycolatopsis sp. Hca4]QKV78198.1 serine hydrolase [Amycolatopsis sp. Hca4]
MGKLLLTALLAAFALGPSASPSPRPAPHVSESDPFGPGLRARITRAQAYADSRPGVTGIVLRDRSTGAVYRSPAAGRLIWACSTPKLAMAVDLLLREDSGAIKLSAQDRDLLHRMLHSSDDAAAHVLWTRYGGETEFGSRFPAYGMSDMRFSDRHPHHWGWIRTTADDLDRLIEYVLTRLPDRHRDYLVRELRTVDGNQQWGVWGAGAAAHPGNKNGWSDDNDDGSWIMNSVGFAGPGERYALALMNDTGVVAGGEETGRETTTRIAGILFAGYFGS